MFHFHSKFNSWSDVVEVVEEAPKFIIAAFPNNESVVHVSKDERNIKIGSGRGMD